MELLYEMAAFASVCAMVACTLWVLVALIRRASVRAPVIMMAVLLMLTAAASLAGGGFSVEPRAAVSSMATEATPTPSRDPAPTPTASGVDVQAFADLVEELMLSKNMSDHYTISADDGVVSICLWYEGTAQGLYAAVQGDADYIALWEDVKAAWISASNRIHEIAVETNTDVRTIIYVLNDENMENILLTIVDGEVVYDALTQ